VAYATEMHQKARDLEAQALAVELSLLPPAVPVLAHSQQQVQQQAQRLAPDAVLKRPTEDGDGK